jgi:hypothetical protein
MTDVENVLKQILEWYENDNKDLTSAKCCIYS